MKKPFVEIGERVQYINPEYPESKHRRGDWPEGSWLEQGLTGTVIEYTPARPPVRIAGELIEGIEPWAVVRWDLPGDCKTAIDPDTEGKRWERLGKEANDAEQGAEEVLSQKRRSTMRIIDARGKPPPTIDNIHRQYPPNHYRQIGTQYPHPTTEKDIREFRERAEQEGAVIIFISEYGQSAYIPIEKGHYAPQVPQVVSPEQNLLKYYDVPPSAS